jgi:hypothetical protein
LSPGFLRSFKVRYFRDARAGRTASKNPGLFSSDVEAKEVRGALVSSNLKSSRSCFVVIFAGLIRQVGRLRPCNSPKPVLVVAMDAGRLGWHQLVDGIGGAESTKFEMSSRRSAIFT